MQPILMSLTFVYYFVLSLVLSFLSALALDLFISVALKNTFVHTTLKISSHFYVANSLIL